MHLGPEFPAGGAGFDGEVDDPRIWQSFADGVREGLEIGENAVGGAAGGEVVVARVEDDQARFVFEDDTVRIVKDVCNVRAAEAAVDDGETGEGVGGLPKTDRGAADEEDRILGRSVFAVVVFKGCDFFGEALGGWGLRLCVAQ